MVLVPGVAVRSSPCAKFPNSLPKARIHVLRRCSSWMSVLYLSMETPVVGWMTGAQKCVWGIVLSCACGGSYGARSVVAALQEG